ncbi:MAG: purine-nucleoside phosphorylase [Oscillospiraceae bacterium]|nr:purine-nucleoside phosphorylase [Oscillospiraceae bacterium]
MSLHINAKPGQIAKNVVVAGDPGRVEYIAKTYLKDAVLVNDQRGALCYTGKYDGEEISVMAVGMGVPSMLIYATELYRDFGCEAIIRIGTSAGYLSEMKKHDVVLAQATCHTSAINDGLFNGTFCPIADYGLLRIADQEAARLGQKVYIGNTICNDRIYRLAESYRSGMWAQYGVLCSEMEGAGLYTAAAQFHKKALMMVSILSHITCDESGKETITPLPVEEGRSIDDAICLALTVAAAHSREERNGAV